MKTSLVSAVITSAGRHFSMARSADGREFYLGLQQGPMGFSVHMGSVILDYVSYSGRVAVGDSILLQSGRRDDRHSNFHANGWGFKIRAEDAWHAYETQPAIAVMQRTRRVLPSGRFGSWGKWERTLLGRPDTICAESDRDGLRVSRTDRLAPNYFTEGFHTQTRFAYENGVEALDPRPFPQHHGGFYRVMRTVAGLPPKEITRGDARTIAFEYPRTEGDELKDYGDVTFTWEKGAGIDANKRPIWVSYPEDPRVPQLKIEALPFDGVDAAALAEQMMAGGLQKAA